MASYAPLFVNTNDRRWNPDAIVYDSSRVYGTPSYWMQLFFAKSSGATYLKTALESSSSSLVASAISWKNGTDDTNYITIKVIILLFITSAFPNGSENFLLVGIL